MQIYPDVAEAFASDLVTTETTKRELAIRAFGVGFFRTRELLMRRLSDEAMSEAEVMERYKLTANGIRRYARKGVIPPPARVGKTLVWFRGELDHLREWIEAEGITGLERAKRYSAEMAQVEREAAILASPDREAARAAIEAELAKE